MIVSKYHRITVLKVPKYQSIVVSSPAASFLFYPKADSPFRRPWVLAYILFCKSKLALRYGKPNLPEGVTDNLPLLTRASSLSPACLHLPWLAFPRQKNIRIPGAGKVWNKREKKKESKFRFMEDALTIVLIILLCLVLRPLISAILRGLGSSEHRRDR